jgi:hypothetical protein
MRSFLLTLFLAVSAAALLASGAAAYKVSPKAPPDGFVGTPYSFTFGADGGSAPHTFRIDSGALPPGLAISDEGAVTGTPTAGGSWSFYVQATDSWGLKSEVRFTINIGQKLTVSTNGLLDATVGVPYSQALATTGGKASGWSVTSGALPPGLALSGAGVISGTPTAIGASTFIVTATSGSQQDTKQLTLTVLAPLGVSVVALPPAIVGTPFTAQVGASGGSGTYSFRLVGGALPSGLTLDGTSGVVGGTPKASGSFTALLSVNAAGGGEAQKAVTLVVSPKLSIRTATLPSGKAGRRYSARIVVGGGLAPVTLSSTSLFPPGIVLNAETGRLVGTPKRRGTYRLSVTAKDSFGGSVTRRLVIRVAG